MDQSQGKALASSQPPQAYTLTTTQLLKQFDTDPQRGLTPAEAAARLQRYGANALPEAPPVPVWRRFLKQFADPLTGLLLVAVAISFVAWLLERESSIPYETITILAIVLLNGVLGFVQENRAEQAVAALKAMASPNARVLRDGTQQQIPTVEVVPGDILLIEEGDTLPADARVLESVSLRVAESALTGESSAVSKDTAVLSGDVGIGDRTNMLFSGTAVASGRGRAIVTTTGSNTEIGRIADTLQHTAETETPLQKELNRVGRFLGIAVIIIAIIIAATILLIGRDTSLNGLVQVLLLAVSLAVAAVPEGLTAITTITLSLGMQRMARRNVIVRKLSAVESLGSTTVICSDKTGTLTKNEMTVRTIVTHGGRVELTGIGYAPQGDVLYHGLPLTDEGLRHEVRRAVRAATLVNNADLIEQDGIWRVQGDPTEGALLVAARKVGYDNDALLERFPRRAEVPFTSERKLMTTTHEDREITERAMVFAKGAPDILLSKCTAELAGEQERPLSAERRREIQASVDELASEALRTLGVAYRKLQRDDGSTFDEEDEREFVFLGIIGMIDPPRPEAQKSVKIAQQAGVRAIMITGDHPKTAAAIATELGIIPPGGKALTGADLQQLNEPQLREIVKEVSVYARVAPEHKLRIVQALQANGEIAAMTGDGVNDAPALKAADIGVAMGITGTDVSKGAADMILTDDNFASIVAAVEEGRSIFQSIREALRYLLSSNMGEVLTMFLGVVLASVFGLAAEAGSAVVLPLLATQILWINLLTDSGPALALAVEPDDPELMKKPPRDPRVPVINAPMWFDIVFVGAIMALGTLLVMDWALPGGFIAGTHEMPYARTLAFTTLVFFQLFNVFNARSDEDSAFHHLFSNMWIWAAVLFSAAMQVVVVYAPFLQTAFGTVALHTADWLICIGVASLVLWLRELVKLGTWLFRR